MFRQKRPIQIFVRKNWITVMARISDSLLCKRPGCNRKPKSNSNHASTKYCSVSCAQKDMRRIKLETKEKD